MSMAHISWVGMFDYIAIIVAGLIVLAAAIVLWKEDRERERQREAELVDITERLRGHERHL